MDLDAFGDVLDRQCGLISRAQVFGHGASRHDIDRWLRRRLLRRVLPSVYLNHTGEPTWWQLAWAATLHVERSSLALSSAITAEGGRATPLPGRAGRPDTIHLSIGPGRHPKVPSWIVLHRCRSLEESTLWAASPPRQRTEWSAVDLAVAHLRSGSKNAHLNAVASLAEPIQARRTTGDRVLASLGSRRRVHQRVWITAVVADVAAGTTSVLEYGFLHRVERPHGLPRVRRQVAAHTVSGRVERDGLLGQRVIELDGRAFHQGSARRDADLERDLDASATGLETTRLGWGQVFDRPCGTAGKVAAVAAAAGWAGSPVACGPGCVAPEMFRRSLAG